VADQRLNQLMQNAVPLEETGDAMAGAGHDIDGHGRAADPGHAPRMARVDRAHVAEEQRIVDVRNQ